MSDLVQQTGIEPHTVRRMLINIQSDGLITVENKQNRYTLITINDWELYNNAVSGWIPMDRALLEECWRTDADYMGVLLYLILSANYGTAQISTTILKLSDDLKLKSDHLRRILKKLERENIIKIENQSNRATVITIIDKRFFEVQKIEIAKPLQNDCNNFVNSVQNTCNPTVIKVQTYKEDKNKELKKKEEEGGGAFLLAEKLSEVFANKKFSRRDDIKILAKYITELIKNNVAPEEIAEAIDWFRKNYFDKIHNAYTFREYFYALSEAVQCEKREAERKEQAQIAEDKKRRLAEEEHERGVQTLREAVAKDKFHLIRITAKNPKFALTSLKNMILHGRATAEEADMLIKELNLQLSPT